jgi:hypothetical protein
VFKYEFSLALLFRSGSHSRVFPFTVDEKGCFVYTGNRKQAQKQYPKVILSGKEYSIHRLILAAQLGRPLRRGYCACHSCDNPRCINPAHLWEGTQEENIADCVSKGRQNPGLPPARFGSEHAGAKLKEADIPEIRQLLNLGISQRLIALKYGVSQSLISLIKLGKIWQHVEE